jgi:hypothetical protein
MIKEHLMHLWVKSCIKFLHKAQIVYYRFITESWRKITIVLTQIRYIYNFWISFTSWHQMLRIINCLSRDIHQIFENIYFFFSAAILIFRLTQLKNYSTFFGGLWWFQRLVLVSNYIRKSKLLKSNILYLFWRA